METLRAFALCGPTASGKSEFASRLAAECGGEVVNADSRQIYQGMCVGTGWPTDEQLARAPHHLYGVASPAETYNAGRFVADATAAIAGIVARGRLPIVSGGTGLYIEALGGSMPLDRPVASDALRERLRDEARTHPHETLRDWLMALEPEAAARIAAGDRYRTLRALEAALALREEAIGCIEGASKRSAGALALEKPAVALRIVVLEADRDVLRARIATRVRSMFDHGIVEEALAIERRFGEVPALTGIGYAEALAYVRGLSGREEAIAAASHRTVAYAKRQQTWFRRIAGAAVCDAFAPSAWSWLRARAREFAAAT